MTEPQSPPSVTETHFDYDPTPRPTHPREIPIFIRSGGSEIWREIVGTERDRDPCGRFVYVAERLITEDRMRERTLSVMREIRSRCYEHDGNGHYRFVRRTEIDQALFVSRIQGDLDGVGEIAVASMKDLVPRPSWMSTDQWQRAFRQYVNVMTGKDESAPTERREPLALLFGHAPHGSIDEFWLPARGVLTGHLVHKSLMGDLSELLALVAAFAAANYQDCFDRAARYVMEVAKAPPMIVAKDGGGFHLIHVCVD